MSSQRRRLGRCRPASSRCRSAIASATAGSTGGGSLAAPAAALLAACSTRQGPNQRWRGQFRCVCWWASEATAESCETNTPEMARPWLKQVLAPRQLHMQTERRRHSLHPDLQFLSLQRRRCCLLPLHWRPPTPSPLLPRLPPPPHGPALPPALVPRSKIMGIKEQRH